MRCAQQLVGAKSPITEQEKRQLFCRYAQGEPLYKICRTLPCGINYAKKLLRQAGVHVRGRKESKQPDPSDVLLITTSFMEARLSVEEIAENVGKSVAAVYDILRNNGISPYIWATFGKKIPSVLHDSVCQDFLRGASVPELAQQHQASESAVHRILYDHGVGRKVSIRLHKREYDNIAHLYAVQLNSSREISACYGVNLSRILTALKKAGVRIRASQEYFTVSVSNAERQAVTSLYKKNKSLTPICGKLGLSKWVVRRILREEGVEVRREKLTKQDEDALIAQYKQKDSTTTDLAKEYGISQASIFAILRRNGLSASRARRLDLGEHQRILSLYEQGHSSLVIGRMLKVENSTVFRTLRRYDKASRSISEARGVKPEIIPEVCQKYASGAMSKDLAAEYGINQSTIIRILARNGIERRSISGYDNIEHALAGEGRFVPVRKTFLYVYSLKRFPGHLKIGISVDPPHRAENPEYGESLLHPPYQLDSRVEAHFLERVILAETAEHAICPKELQEKWNGWTEVRRMEFDALTEVVEWAYNELIDLGVWQFGYFHVPMTDLQRQQCLEKAQGAT